MKVIVFLLFGSLLCQFLNCASVQDKSKIVPEKDDAEAKWSRIKNSDSPYSFEFYLNDYPNSPYAAEARAKLQSFKEELRIVRIYEGSPRADSEVAVLMTSEDNIQLPEFSKPGVAFVATLGKQEINTNYTEEIHCLPGPYTVTILVQFRPDNVPDGGFAVNSSRFDVDWQAMQGHTYRVAFDKIEKRAYILDVTDH